MQGWLDHNHSAYQHDLEIAALVEVCAVQQVNTEISHPAAVLEVPAFEVEILLVRVVSYLQTMDA